MDARRKEKGVASVYVDKSAPSSKGHVEQWQNDH